MGRARAARLVRRVSPGVVDLLGVLAYGELSAFDRMATDARWPRRWAGRVALSQMAAAEMGHFGRWPAISPGTASPSRTAMQPFDRPLEAFHDSTAPHSWLESLVKAHVGDGLAADFYREIAEWLDPETRDLVFEVLGDTGHSAFAVREVRRACQADPQADRPAGAVGPPAARRGAHPGAVRRRRTGVAGQADRDRIRVTWPASRRCSAGCSTATPTG